MKISIIVPVYNVAPYVGRCINSVIGQTYDGPLECIIVDDKGQDNSMEIVREILSSYTGKIEFHIIVHESNKGLSGARNTGIKNAQGDYVYFLDSDDEIVPECIECMAKIAVLYPGVDIVQGNMVVTDEYYRGYDISRRNFPPFSSDRKWIIRHMLEDIPTTAWNKLIRRQLILDHALYFKEGLAKEDEHWKFSSYRKISSIAFCNKPTYIYYVNPGSLTQMRYKDWDLHSMMAIYREFLSSVPSLRQYRTELRIAQDLMAKPSDFANPEECLEDFKQLLREQLKSPAVPKMAKITLYQLLHPSPYLNALCWVYDRVYYRYMKYFG